MGEDDTRAGSGDARPPDDDGGVYGVFGEGEPRHIVGDSDEPPRRRPRRKRGDASTGEQPGGG